MQDSYLLQSSSLEKLFHKLNETRHIYAPVKKGKITSFNRVESLDEVAKDYIQTTISAKSILFLRNEILFHYKQENGDIPIKESDLQKIPEMVIWGCRPCDAKSFKSLSSVFNGDYKDIIYSSREARSAIISFSCNEADEYCFCTSAGSGPGNTEGSDILLTRLKSGDYLAEILTEKGQLIRELIPALFEASSTERKEENLARVPVVFDTAALKQKLEQAWDSELWITQSMRCLGCGACAFVCPSCSCFDIQDEKHGKEGVRSRCWDSCGFSLFTRHTSGHNPRETQAERWRQRIMHKFSYLPDQQGFTGCTGCGRCSRACPADMNIREHLAALIHDHITPENRVA